MTTLDEKRTFIVTDLRKKAAQSYGEFLGYFENITLEVKTAMATFVVNFEKVLGIFNSPSGHTGYHITHTRRLIGFSLPSHMGSACPRKLFSDLTYSWSLEAGMSKKKSFYSIN